MHGNLAGITEGLAMNRRYVQNRSRAGPALPGRDAMTRRRFALAAAGAALGSGLLRPTSAGAHSGRDPKPIPGGSPLLGGDFHVFGPAFPTDPTDPIDSEPATITDFFGFVGLAYLSGEVRRTNVVTGEVRTLPFVDSDMRFMKGVFRSTDGRFYQGAFAFT